MRLSIEEVGTDKFSTRRIFPSLHPFDFIGIGVDLISNFNQPNSKILRSMYGINGDGSLERSTLLVPNFERGRIGMGG